MHSIHTTPGFIIGSRPYGEAGKLISIFTRDFGLVTAAAQGIRLEKSKLRYSSQDSSFGEFSLVRGREMWRLTGAAPYGPSGPSNRSHPIMSKLALLLGRLLQGEDPHPELFDRIEAVAAFLGGSGDLSGEREASLESLSVLRVMRALGYVGDSKDIAGYADGIEIDAGLLDSVARDRAALNAHINKALKESQL